MKKVFFATIVVLLTGCVSGRVNYIPFSDIQTDKSSYERVIDENIEIVWKAAITYIGKTFFVLDNVLRDSYLINASFSADDPTRYIECGQIESTVSSLRDRRSYVFPAASRYRKYETAENAKLFYVERQVNLSGEINIMFFNINDKQTKIKVNARYLVTKDISVLQAGTQIPQNFSSTLSFNTGGSSSDQTGMTCRPTYELEQTIINGILDNLKNI